MIGGQNLIRQSIEYTPQVNKKSLGGELLRGTFFPQKMKNHFFDFEKSEKMERM